MDEQCDEQRKVTRVLLSFTIQHLTFVLEQCHIVSHLFSSSPFLTYFSHHRLVFHLISPRLSFLIHDLIHPSHMFLHLMFPFLSPTADITNRSSRMCGCTHGCEHVLMCGSVWTSTGAEHVRRHDSQETKLTSTSTVHAHERIGVPRL